MRPPVPAVLGTVIRHFTARAQTVSDPELAAELRWLVGGLQTFVQEYDECASMRVDEILALSELLSRGVMLAGERFDWDHDLQRDPFGDLRISVLEARLDTLRARLIELQTWLEDEPGPDAARLLDASYQLEYATAQRRTFRLMDL